MGYLVPNTLFFFFFYFIRLFAHQHRFDSAIQREHFQQFIPCESLVPNYSLIGLLKPELIYSIDSAMSQPTKTRAGFFCTILLNVNFP